MKINNYFRRFNNKLNQKNNNVKIYKNKFNFLNKLKKIKNFYMILVKVKKE